MLIFFRMYLNGISYYLPKRRIKNDHFADLSGISDEWIIERTGIKERRRAAKNENTHTMGVEAVRRMDADLSDVDLIVGATYTPYDTVVTLAHAIQNHLNISDIPVVTVSSACSSFINAAEIVEGYFAMGKATKALVITSEHNSAFSYDEEPKSGPLWGDGAAVALFEKDRSEDGFLVKAIKSAGAANVSKAMQGVMLHPKTGLSMPNGKDVFINACSKMSMITEQILKENSMVLADLDYLAPHQANLRITKKVLSNLGLTEKKALSNIQYLGNTGCAGAVIAIGEKWDEFKSGDVVVSSVFGGGYSYGAMLLIR